MSYPVLESYASIQNVLFIDDSVTQAHVFYDSASSNTLPILYNSKSSAVEINAFLSSHFTSLQRIAFVFDGPANETGFYPKSFLDSKPFFELDTYIDTSYLEESNHIKQKPEDVSNGIFLCDNIRFLKNLIQQFNILRVDFLGCNLLQSQRWKNYFSLLSDICIVGASNDETGNLNYGGDWVLENTMEDIKSVYFSSGIENYSSTLLTTGISSSKTLTQNGDGDLTDGTTVYNWKTSGPIPITGSNIVITFGGNFTITTTTQCFQVNSSRTNVTFDGQNNTITVNSVPSYPGLFAQMEASFCTIKNIIIHSTGTTSASVNQYNQGKNGLFIVNDAIGSDIVFRNCVTKGQFDVVENYGAGFFTGPNPAFSGNVSFINCSNSIPITKFNGAGIIGGYGAIRNDVGCTLNVINCSNSGAITGEKSCGIIGFGFLVSKNGGIINITNCYNTGDINSTKDNAGIAGGMLGVNGGGYAPGPANITINVSYCYNLGNITWSDANSIGGGLLGDSLGFNAIGTGVALNHFKTYNISNCYNLGTITCPGDKFGDIIGGWTTNYTDTKTNFYSAQTTIHFNNCYAKGIFYGKINNPTYALPVINISNCYLFGASWSDSTASGLLTSSIWKSMFPNTPYILASAPVSAYVPNSTTQTGVSTYTVPVAPNVFSGTSFTVTVNGNVSSYATMASSGNIIFQNIPSSTSASYTAQVLSYTPVNGQYAAYAFSSFTLTNKAIPALETLDPSSNTFSFSLSTPGVTITSKEELATNIKAFLTSNASSLASGNLVITGSTLPGFSNFSLKNTSNQIAVFNSSSTCGTNFKSVFSNNELVNKAFYILQDTSGDVTTLTTFNGIPVVVTNIGTGFTIKAGDAPVVNYAAGSTFSLDGLRFSLGSIFGEATNVVCFSEDAKILCCRDDEEVYVPIKEIRKGELVKTYAHGYIPVDIIGHSKINHTIDSEYKYQLFKLTQEKYPELFEDLLLTGCHSILTKTLTETQKKESIRLQGKLFVTDGHYRLMSCLDERAELYEKEGHYTIWHLALEHDDYFMNYGIYANGLLVESSSKRMMYEYSGMTIV